VPYRKRCERDGLELESMWLGEDDIEPDTGGPAVIGQPTSIVTRPLNEKDQDDSPKPGLRASGGSSGRCGRPESLRKRGGTRQRGTPEAAAARPARSARG
jgi:hypothetical protein